MRNEEKMNDMNRKVLDGGMNGFEHYIKKMNE